MNWSIFTPVMCVWLISQSRSENRIFSSKSDRSLASILPKTSYFTSDFEIEEKERKMVGRWRNLSRTQGKCWHLEKIFL